TATRPGVNLLPDRADDLLPALRRLLEPVRRPGDVVVASIHWGGNWGFDVPAAQSALADRLTKEGRVDVVMGHSSHHPKEVMVMNGKLVLFGCGDLINDYEGIGGHQTFLPDVAVGYVIDLSVSDGALWQVDALVYERRAFRLQRAGPELRDRVLPILAKDFPGKVSAAGANRLRFLP
ncbi:MAG: CapA family protein, partial [Paracoccaceae bacterium]